MAADSRSAAVTSWASAQAHLNNVHKYVDFFYPSLSADELMIYEFISVIWLALWTSKDYP